MATLQDILSDGTRLKFKFGFTPPDREPRQLPKINIYREDTGEFLLALVFEPGEFPTIREWAGRI